MLSYQHAYHAGNLADIHKHAALCCVLDYLTQKDKPISVIETHAGRGLYRLNAPEAIKTGEAALGIERFTSENRIPAHHPYARCLSAIKARYGENAYPGSPLIAAQMLQSRLNDKIYLAEMHPQEVIALRENMAGYNVKITQKDGLKHANRLIPPEPRRGIMLIDPSYEIKSEYVDMADFITKMHRKWSVGVIVLWYPLLDSGAHIPMIEALKNYTLAAGNVEHINHEISFRHLNNPQHRMNGSGLFILNPPFGMQEMFDEIETFFNKTP